MSDFIPVAEAAQMNASYRMNREMILRPEYQGKNILCICETFEKSQVETLLSKEGCAALRVYYGMDASMKVHAVLCAVDEENADILPAARSAVASSPQGQGDDYTLENGQRCPVDCPPDSQLNNPPNP
jgi:hypothetical protein